MFTENRDKPKFDWSDLGNIAEGRPNLGDTTTVTVYRLMQYTLRDEIIRRFDPQVAAEIFYQAGWQAGIKLTEQLLDTSKELNEFMADLQHVLKEQKVGILRVEKADLESLSFEVSVYEDLDCSGLPMLNETVCEYDEGFLAGVMEVYLGRPMRAREVDCWATGGRVCRFEINQA